MNDHEPITGREFREAAEQAGKTVGKVGGYFFVEDGKGGRTYFPNSDSVLPKPLRERIAQMLRLAGIVTALVMLTVTFLG